MLRSHLQRQLAALQQEEEAWINIRCKSEQQGVEASGSAPASDPINGEAVADGEKAASPEEAGEGDPPPVAAAAAAATSSSDDLSSRAPTSMLKQTVESVNFTMGMQASLSMLSLLPKCLVYIISTLSIQQLSPCSF
jgi:hypothetical protein